MIIKKWQAEDSRKDKNNKPHEETTRAPKVPSFAWPRRVVAWLGPLDDSAPPGFGPQCRVGFLLTPMHRWIIGFKSLAPVSTLGHLPNCRTKILVPLRLPQHRTHRWTKNPSSAASESEDWLELEEPAFSPQSTTQNRRIVQILWGSNLAKFPQDPAPNHPPLLNSTAPGGVLFCFLA